MGRDERLRPVGMNLKDSYTLTWAASATGGERWGKEISFPLPIAVDSREARRGGAFLAIRGRCKNGHDFIGDALNRGVALVMGEREFLLPWARKIEKAGAGALAFKENSERGCIRLAQAYFREIHPGVVVAITGSVGKTTCRELATRALSAEYNVHQAQKSHNTAIGCALTVLSMAKGTEILVLEMGCNHYGEIAEMVDLFPPHIAIITEIAPAHLQGLGSVEGVLRAKLEIMNSHRLEAVSYNADNDRLRKALATLPPGVEGISVGYDAFSRFRFTEVTQSLNEGEPSLALRARWQDRELFLKSGLFGRHQAYALGFAAALSSYLGVHGFEKALADVRSLPGRGGVFRRRGGGVVVDESYNANPLSMRAALDAFAGLVEKKGGWALLGSMGELGEDAKSLHRLLLEEASLPEKLLLLGELWPLNGLPSQARRIVSVEEALEILKEEFLSGESILVKGSRIWELERVVQWILEE